MSYLPRESGGIGGRCGESFCIDLHRKDVSAKDSEGNDIRNKRIRVASQIY
jgi:hypothetical protein